MRNTRRSTTTFAAAVAAGLFGCFILLDGSSLRVSVLNLLAHANVKKVGDGHNVRRKLAASGVEYYLDTGAAVNGDGLSASSPFNNADYALDQLAPGDTLYLQGTVTNPSYDPTFKDTWNGGVGNDHLWHEENTLNIKNVRGTADARITIRPAPGTEGSTVLRGDGNNIIVVGDCEYLDIVGLHIYGEVNNITLETAKKLQFVFRDASAPDPMEVQFRVDRKYKRYTDLENLYLTEEEKAGLKNLPELNSENISRPSYTSTRGIYVQKSYEITIQDCEVHHMPGGGIRVSDSEYIDVINNEVHNNARRSYAGTHAIVATKTRDDRGGSRSGQAKYRVRILANRVHHNYNEIYSWAPGKTEIHNIIDEGKGVSLQRNQAFQYGGRILVANNIAYYNGYSGIHSNDGDNIDFFGNTAYLNSYTTSVTYGYQSGAVNVGISLSDGKDCKVGNNIAVVDTDVNAAAITMTSTSDAVIHTNIMWGVGTADLKTDSDVVAVEQNPIVGDPLFADPPTSPTDLASANFAPLADSLALGAGKPRFSIDVDYFGDVRDSNNPTIGAIENFYGCVWC